MSANDPNASSQPDASAGGDGSTGRRAVAEMLGDRYQVVSRLGSGAFGEVYEADDTTLGRRVAIKRIRLDVFAEGPELEDVKARFLREAQVAAQLRHSNVVTIHDIAAKGATSFMVMELVEGRTLQAVLRDRGRLGVDETLRILSQAAAALDYAHASGVVHRDVKPANLMIEPSGHVKVMDFGIAKGRSSGDITRTGTILGTPNYMSPEQARGGDVDGRSDLFSLGCILYECLTGRRPFGGDSVTAILLKIVNEDPPAVDFDALGLPAALGGVLRKALAKDPANRYPTGERLVAAAREAARSAVDTLGGAAATERPAPLVPPPAPVPPPVPAHVFSVPAPPADPRPATPPAPSPRRGSPWKLAALAAAAIVAAVVVWGVSASQRGSRPAAAAKAPQEDPQIVRVSANVTREEPTMVKRLMGAKPRLHVTVPEGTSLSVRLDTPLSSETARPEQAFTASTDLPLVVDGFETFPAGSRITGHVAHAAGAGKVSGRGELTLEFDRISPPGRGEIPIEAEPLQRRARATVKKDAKKVGGGAVIGAVVGGLLGGKKGAAIGGAVGGTAGAGAVLATKGEEVVLKEGVRFEVRLRAPVRLTLPAPES